MRIQPLIQTTLFDTTEWDIDSEFAVFPQGTRAKDAVFAPDAPNDPVIVAGKRYLFKRSRRSYPDQFWAEIIAYRIGCILGVEVPPAFAAYNSLSGECGALIEWFYSDGKELFVPAGDFLQKTQPGFDRRYGTTHNLHHNSILMRALIQTKTLDANWRQWWVDALLFDALIGNTDRHQDNWGFIFFSLGKNLTDLRCKPTPLFDNGTSLGFERFPERVKNWGDAEVNTYVNKGCHHVKWALADNQLVPRSHMELLKHALSEWPETRDVARDRLGFSDEDTSNAIADLTRIGAPVPLSTDRISFVSRLLAIRHARLKSILA